jgi:hypothetical protein
VRWGADLIALQVVFFDTIDLHSLRIRRTPLVKFDAALTNDLLSRSLSLNPVENFCGILLRDFYADCRQYDNVNQLKEAIQKTWDWVPLDRLSPLVNGMPNRMIQVIERHRKVTDY